MNKYAPPSDHPNQRPKYTSKIMLDATPELKAALAEAAAFAGLSKADAMRTAIEQWIERVTEKRNDS